jgi:hypothetical protein
MKLLRYGAPGSERPGLLDAGGTIRDLSASLPISAAAPSLPKALPVWR